MGRRPVILWSTALFLAFTVACGVAQNSAQFIVFRVLSGLGGCAPLAVGVASVGDMYTPQERGSAMAVYMGLQLAGPAVRTTNTGNNSIYQLTCFRTARPDSRWLDPSIHRQLAVVVLRLRNRHGHCPRHGNGLAPRDIRTQTQPQGAPITPRHPSGFA